MDESDSESDAGTPNFGEGDRYPLEGKYKDEEDRAEILAMPEIKREELLAERASQTERDRQNRALRQLLQARDQEKKMQEKKRKAGDDDIEEGNRKTSRQRTKVGGGRVGEQSSGIDSLKKARDEKADRQRRRQEDLDRNGPRQVDQHQSEDELSDDEYAWDAPKRNEPTKIQSTPATLGDIERLRVGRSFFARFAFYPGYEEALKGTYARVCIGLDRSGKNQLYRMAEIIGKLS